MEKLKAPRVALPLDRAIGTFTVAPGGADTSAIVNEGPALDVACTDPCALIRNRQSNRESQR